MARSREGAEGDLNELQIAAVLEPHVGASAERMLGRHDRGASGRLELGGAREKIFLTMRLDRLFQAKGNWPGKLQVLGNVALRVDDPSEVAVPIK